MRATADFSNVRAAFDRVAPTFDAVVVRNPINAWMHDVNMERVRGTFPPESHLLELGCGTGTDAIELARGGRSVFAIDVSPAMVAKAREKVAAWNLEGRIVLACGPSSGLLDLVHESPWRPFDGGYANFTLTYERSLPTIARDLATVLKPNAFFLCTLPNRVILSEVALYGPLLRFKDVLQNLREPFLKDVHGSLVESHAYSPWQVREAFSEWFRLQEIVGIPTFLPPIYLHLQYRRLGGGQRLLKALDRRLAPRYPWNHLGGHTFYKFRRRGS